MNIMFEFRKVANSLKLLLLVLLLADIYMLRSLSIMAINFRLTITGNYEIF